MKMYELEPRDSHKSFYGKALVVRTDDDSRLVLFSYQTAIISKLRDGSLVRHWDDWSATTGRHIKAFCGLSKQEFLALPYVEMD